MVFTNKPYLRLPVALLLTLISHDTCYCVLMAQIDYVPTPHHEPVPPFFIKTY